jgi:hypothetical protein
MRQIKKEKKKKMLRNNFGLKLAIYFATIMCNFASFAQDQSSFHAVYENKNPIFTEFTDEDYYKFTYLRDWRINHNNRFESFSDGCAFCGIDVNNKGYIVTTTLSDSSDENFPNRKSIYPYATRIFKIGFVNNKAGGLRESVQLKEREATEREKKDIYEYCQVGEVHYPDAILDNKEIKSIIPKGVRINLYLKEELRLTKHIFSYAKAIKAVSIICIIQKVLRSTAKSKLLTVAASAVGVLFVEVGA